MNDVRYSSRKDTESTYGIELSQIPPLRKMSTQARLRTPACNTTQGTQDACRAENAHAHRPGWNHWRETVHDHGDVVEYIGC